MKFESPLIKATLVRRYKRFLADVVLENLDSFEHNHHTAHCPNTGSMLTCGAAGDTVYLSYNPSPSRKYPLTWEYTQIPEGFIGVNTHRPNLIVGEALTARKIPTLAHFTHIKKEATCGDSRFDFLLTGNFQNGEASEKLENGVWHQNSADSRAWVEVKNVTLRSDQQILFPDAVSERGLKHLQHLSALAQKGERCVMLFLINRPDAESFGCAKHIDPAYHEGLLEAMRCGVEVLAYRSHLTLTEAKLGDIIRINL